MFKCWKCSSGDPLSVEFIIFIALFWRLMRGCMVGFEAGRIFPGGQSRIFAQVNIKIFQRWPKVMKFNFSLSKLRKRPFLLKV